MTKRISFSQFILVFPIMLFCWTVPKSYYYFDKYGNKITIENFDKLPKQLDSTFFQSNLSGIDFHLHQNDSSILHNYYIIDIKTIKKLREYEFVVSMSTQTADSNNIEEILKHQGLTHFSMTIIRENKSYRKDEVHCLYGEL